MTQYNDKEMYSMLCECIDRVLCEGGNGEGHKNKQDMTVYMPDGEEVDVRCHPDSAYIAAKSKRDNPFPRVGRAERNLEKARRKAKGAKRVADMKYNNMLQYKLPFDETISRIIKDYIR